MLHNSSLSKNLVRQYVVQYCFKGAINLFLHRQYRKSVRWFSALIFTATLVMVITGHFFSDDRPSSSSATRLERIVRVKCFSVFNAFARCAFAGSSGPSRLPDGRRPSCGLHGPYPHIPRTSGKAQSASCRFCRI